MTKNITVNPTKSADTAQEQTSETVNTTDVVKTAVKTPLVLNTETEQAFPGTTDTRTVADVDKEIKQTNAETLANKIPSNWVITPGEGDNIVAVNNITKKTFEGSVEDFNQILRG